MKELLPILTMSMVLALAADYASPKTVDRWDNQYYESKNRVLIVIMGVMLAVFVGLRTGYNDTFTYINMYNAMDPKLPLGSDINWIQIGNNPGFEFTNQLLVKLGVSSQSYLMIYAIVTVGIYIWFIRKYTENIWLSVFLFFAMGAYTFSMAAIKQCIAVAFCLIATDCVIEQKYVGFAVWTVIATLFHPYAIMFFIVPFLTFKPWSKRTYVLLLATIAVGLLLQRLLGTVITITSMMGKDYDIELISGEGVNLFRVAVTWAPIVLSFIARKNVQFRNNRYNNIIVNLSMVNAMIMFIAIFGTANYFARLANYFMLFQVLIIPLLLNAFNRSSKNLVIFIVVTCYSLYFYYSTAIMYGGFDSMHSGITLVQYLKQFL